MPSAPSRRRACARAGLLWGLALFVSGQLALTALSERWRPELSAPEFGERLKRLRRLLAEAPGRPLVVALGSSRTSFGFRPDALPPCRCPAEQEPVAFNFSQLGGGPLMELHCLRRLLAGGIHPRCVLVEVLCPFFHAERTLAEETLFWRQLAQSERPRLGMPLSPWYLLRANLLARYAPRLLPRNSPARRELVCWRRCLDRAGWLRHPALPPDGYRRGLDLARHTFAAYLAHAAIAAGPDRALRELLGVCRREGIAVLLFAAPEASELRHWPRGAAAEKQFHAYLDGVCREYGIHWLDARSWLDDASFADGHHLLPAGAQAFTERLGRDALQPLLEGRFEARNLKSEIQKEEGVVFGFRVSDFGFRVSDFGAVR